jgi:hypothetical protein
MFGPVVSIFPVSKMQRSLRHALVSFSLLTGVFASSLAHGEVKITVDLSRQRMEAVHDGPSADWAVSSGRTGFDTPAGVYGVVDMQPLHLSKKYDNAPMPNSIFFHGGYAIHGTSDSRHLGRPASHGCIRLSISHSKILYDWVEAEGASIRIVGTPPHGRVADEPAPDADGASAPPEAPRPHQRRRELSNGADVIYQSFPDAFAQ